MGLDIIGRILFFKVTAVLGCVMVMVVYLGLDGRFPLRVFQVCILPAIVILGNIWVKESGWLESGKRLNAIICMVFAVCSMGACLYTYNVSADPDTERGVETRIGMEKYAIEHQENIYIYDYSMCFSSTPFVVYPKEKPTNYIFWGGTMMFSPIYDRQLICNKKEELYAEAFLEDNVYFVSMDKMNEETLLYKYMREQFGNVNFAQIDKVNECLIYKFSK